MAAKFDFNLGDYQPFTGTEVVPSGWYSGKIINSETIETNAKDGVNIVLDIEITHGAHAGTTVRYRGLIHSKNESANVAVEMTRRNMATLNKVLGTKTTIKDAGAWHGVPFNFKVEQITSEWVDDKGENRTNQQNRFQAFKEYKELPTNGLELPSEDEAPDWKSQVT